jgi:endoglucanase
MAEDAYLGNAEFSVTVNGQAVGGIMTVTALQDAGQEQAFTLPGNFGAGPVNVAVTFLNDANGPGGDRNLYVDGITYHGYAQANDTAPIYSDGTANFSVQEPGAVDTLTLYVSEDYYLGDAEFSVTVDGNPVGGTLTATGSHAAGGTTPVTLTGVFGPGPHTVVVTFLNDANGGNSSLDRNLYVSGIDYNGVYTGVDASLYYTGAASTTVVGVPGVAPTVPLADMSAPGTFQYVGVNLSGLEFGGPVYPGVLNKDYVVPTDAEIDYYKSEGMNIIRLPFDWERLQPVMNGPLNQTYLGLIDGVVSYAASKGMTVDLDVHNYGTYYGNDIGTAAVPNSAFANLWSQLATHYASTPNVLFGLMNEPQETSATQWVGSANAAIAAIRAAGANQEILVAGIDNGGGESWTTSDNASAMLGIVDPKMNFAYEIHQYLNGGGDLPVTTVDGPPTLGVSDLTAVTQWAAATGSKLFLGEFGAGTDAASLTAMKNMLTYMGQNTNVWQGLTEWGGGPWWGNYGFATDPVNGVTQPQIDLLKSFE